METRGKRRKREAQDEVDYSAMDEYLNKFVHPRKRSRELYEVLAQTDVSVVEDVPIELPEDEPADEDRAVREKLAMYLHEQEHNVDSQTSTGSQAVPGIDTVPKPNEIDPWESDEEEEVERDLEANYDPEAIPLQQDNVQVNVPPQSSTGNQLRDELLEIYTELAGQPCCHRKCLNSFEFEAIYQQVLDLRGQTGANREAVVMGLLMARSVLRSENRKRSIYNHSVFGKTVCEGVFCLAFDCKRNKLDAIKKHLNENGCIPRIHGNTGKTPWHAMTYEDAKFIVDYLRNLAKREGLQQPIPEHAQDLPITLLPAGYTRKSVHLKYQEACRDKDTRVLEKTAFFGVWDNICPNIKTSRARSDCCNKCETLRTAICDAETDEEKRITGEAFLSHVTAAHTEKEFYGAEIDRARDSFEASSDQRENVHLTFDFAQPCILPQHVRQRGSLYFENPIKIQVFGIADEGRFAQSNYLINEDETVGLDGTGTHGPDTVISILHHRLDQLPNVKQISLHADNCCGQNKNRFVLSFLCWYKMVHPEKEISLHFQVAGHTRCLVDAGFGQAKRKFRSNNVETVQDLAACFSSDSVKGNSAVLYQGGQGWQWRPWKLFLKDYFLGLDGITKYQHFWIEGAGKLKTSVSPNSDHNTVTLVKADVIVPLTPPDPIDAAGLSKDRAKYRFKKLRPYFTARNRDLMCPPP